MSNPSLFDVEDQPEPPRVRDMTVGPVSSSDVREFARRYHYSGVANNINWRWGLWHGPVLYGVIAYNLPTRSVCSSVFGEGLHDHVWHMAKLAMSDLAPKNSESRLIAGSLRQIERSHPHVWAVLTYAATDAGHVGYVYQATNAIYTGQGGDPYYYIDKDGARRGTHLDGRGVSVARAIDMGWTRKKGGPKHRYVYLLGSKTQKRERLLRLRLPVLPVYPKSLGEDLTDV